MGTHLQPRSQRCQVGRGVRDALQVGARKVDIQVLVNVNCRVVQRVLELVHEGGARVRALGPGVPTGPAVAGHDDQVGGVGRANGVDGGLVVGEDERRGHVVGLVHEPEDDALVVGEPRRELAPELAKLRRRRGVGVGRVPDDAARVWLGAGVVVSHVVVRIENGIGALGRGDIVHGLLEVVEVRLVERGTESRGWRVHALEEKGDAEEVDFVLVHMDINGCLVDEGVVNTKCARQTSARRCSRGPNTELAA